MTKLKKINVEPLHEPKVRANLDLNKEVHRSAKNIKPKTWLFEATVGTTEKMGKKEEKKRKETLELEFSRGLVSCPRV